MYNRKTTTQQLGLWLACLINKRAKSKADKMIFLRDLVEPIRRDFEKDIRKNRPDLISALEEGLDIEVGDYYKSSDYKVV